MSGVDQHAFGDLHLVLKRYLATRPWGEQSFYLRDPFGNPLCMVHRPTAFNGS